MQRDELDTTTDSNHPQYNGTLGMFYELLTNSSESIIVKELPSSEKFITTTLSFEERFRLQEKEFYKSYNPKVGFNTAIVLGGMLVLLVVYVVYRTKCRKFIIRQCNNLFKKERELITPEAMKFTFDDRDVDADDFQENFDNPGIGSDDASCIQYGSGTNHSFSTGNRTPATHLPHQFSMKDENGQKLYTRVPTLTLSDEDKRLPVVVMDMKLATADWVQKQYQFLDPGGIILKVKSDTICPPGNEIYPSASAAANSRGVSCANSHQYSNSKERQYDGTSHCTLNLNNSLPVLEIPEISLLNTNQSTQYKKRGDFRTRKFPSVSSEPKSPLHPPMHITPIIKIQNYDKSQRKLTRSQTKESRDSISSSSSDDPLIYRIPEDERNTHVPKQSVVSEEGDSLSACIACALGQFTPVQSPQTRTDGSTRPKLPQKQQSLTIPVIKYPTQHSLSRCHTTETPL